MLFQIASFLLDVLAGLLSGACLLRLYMQWQRVPFGNPIGRLVFAVTDWLILPLRKLVPSLGRWDVSSLVAALLMQLLHYGLLWLLLGAPLALLWNWLPWMSLLGLVSVALSGLMGLVLVHAVLSWVASHSPLVGVIARLCEPLLQPVRRVLPRLGGVDLSPLVVLIGLQVCAIVLANVQQQWVGR